MPSTLFPVNFALENTRSSLVPLLTSSMTATVRQDRLWIHFYQELPLINDHS